MSNDLTVNINNIVTKSAGQFASILTQYKWDLLPDTQLQAAKQALTKSDYIMKIACQDVGAVHDALMKSAILGLDLTEGKRQGWLLPRKNSSGQTVIQLQVGYKGVEAVHQKMGVIDRLVIRVVHKNDSFEWSGDDQEKPSHQGNWFGNEEDRGEIVGAYAITYYPDGSINVTVTPISEIYGKHRDLSDSWKSYQQKVKSGQNAFPPPWVTHEKAMIEKTMAYIASKQWPANIRNQETSSKILETLHEVDVSDYSHKFTKEQRDAFHQFIEAKDSLGLFLFSRHVDMETYAALAGTFQKGEKTKMKAQVREMEMEGHALLEEIKLGLTENDSGKVLENLDGCVEVTARLVRNALTDELRMAFDETVNAA